ncbi:MAG: alpha/beta hydrolase-fold protein [Ignavibacteria bacterium]|nr:alpha/beta hydrolase-fold protein [Ignavibacteria bacterium]
MTFECRILYRPAAVAISPLHPYIALSSTTGPDLFLPMTLRILFIASLIAAGSTAQSQSFQDFLDSVNEAPDSLQTAIVDSFVTAQPVSPVLEFDSLAHFYYRGAATSVSVPGDASLWNPASVPMTRLATTTFWYRTEVYESDARLDYKYVLNGSTWILDPRNPNTVQGGFGPNSELRMPEFIHPPEIAYYPSIPHGSLRDSTFFSSNLGNSRTIRIYTPPGYGSPLDSFPMVLFHDGLEYTSLASAANVLDYLIDEGRIEPVIAVFVPPVNRTDEYAGSLQDEFTLFLVDELMPWLETHWRIKAGPENRATLGASNGGNIALWLGMNHPEVFGNVAAHSSNIQSSISDGFANGPLLDLRLYMDLGTYDIPLLITLVRDFIPILESRGYVHTYQELHDGHSWGNWRGHIDDALEMFFPGPVLSAPGEGSVPRQFRLDQNYPNPFNPSTEIRFEVPPGRGEVSLLIFDLLGRSIATLVDESLDPGIYSRTWHADGVASGAYFYRLVAGGFGETRKMLLVR